MPYRIKYLLATCRDNYAQYPNEDFEHEFDAKKRAIELFERADVAGVEIYYKAN